jgi:hypothetical protein
MSVFEWISMVLAVASFLLQAMDSFRHSKKW